MTDSTTAKGWMQKLNFDESGKDPIQASVCADAARHHAKLFMDTNIKRIQSVVHGETEQRRGRSLLGLAP